MFPSTSNFSNKLNKNNKFFKFNNNIEENKMKIKETFKNLFNLNLELRQKNISFNNNFIINNYFSNPINMTYPRLITNKNKFNLDFYNNFKNNNKKKIHNNLTLNFKNSLSPKDTTIRNCVTVRKQQMLIHRFLKFMSIYNLDIQGTFLYFNRFIAFNFNHDRNKLIKEIYDILFFAFKSMSCLISKPVFSFKTDKIIIHLFYFLISPVFLKFNRPLRNSLSKTKKIKTSRRSTSYGGKSLIKGSHAQSMKNKSFFKTVTGQNKYNKLDFNEIIELKRKKKIFRNYKFKKKFIKIYYNNLVNKPLTLIYTAKFKALCFILSKFFNKPVELNLIRVHYPYSNSNILVNFFALFVNKVKVIRVVQKLFNNAIFKNIVKNKFGISSFNNKGKNNKDFILPAFLTGMNIKIAGRLLRDKIRPRKTIKFFNKGVYAHSKLNYKDFARFTTKNKRGIFSISINSSQSFFNKY